MKKHAKPVDVFGIAGDPDGLCVEIERQHHRHLGGTRPDRRFFAHLVSPHRSAVSSSARAASPQIANRLTQLGLDIGAGDGALYKKLISRLCPRVWPSI
jgi:hypothetical protein